MRKLLIALLLCLLPVRADALRGREFIALTNLPGSFVSEWIAPRIAWDELVASWNYRSEPDQGITLETQVSFEGRETKWYCLGKWSLAPGKFPRASIKGQRDSDGTVATDTLKMNRRGGLVRLRITTTDSKPVEYVALAFSDSSAALEPLAPNTSAWGKVIAVEERSQADFPEGINEWCSPTATSMLLNFWADKLARSELNYSVPRTAEAVHDPNWPGTGNWPFNTAFAGSHQGIRACVARFSDISEIEDWIAAGIPICFSASYGLLKGDTEKGNGHLLVAIGFTESGDIIVNDPGRRQVRQTYTRANLQRAWAQSQNTVYLIYPEGWSLPRDRFGHWSNRVK